MQKKFYVGFWDMWRADAVRLSLPGSHVKRPELSLRMRRTFEKLINHLVDPEYISSKFM
jgi:hypothetical protein